MLMGLPPDCHRLPPASDCRLLMASFCARQVDQSGDDIEAVANTSKEQKYKNREARRRGLLGKRTPSCL
jgi:hypothetical protein